MEFEWVRETYTGCTRNLKSGLAWFKGGIWKLRETRKVSEKGRRPLCRGEDVLQIALKCFETRKQREQFFSRKLLILNEEVAYKRMINCTNAAELRNVGKYWYEARCK
jgi:hypothetical protein